MKSERSKIVGKADKYFSLYIRARDNKKYNGICPICLSGTIEQCFHIISRKEYAIRWNEKNAIGSCAKCNMLFKQQPHRIFPALMLVIGGLEKYKKLCQMAKIKTKITNWDLEQIIEKCKIKIKELEK